MPPGTVKYFGEKKGRVRVTVMDYDEQRVEEKEVREAAECFPFKGTGSVTWVHVAGLHDTKLVEDLCACFDVHPLIMEDIVTVGQQPKMEDMDEYLFLVLNTFSYEKEELVVEQVSIIVCANFVLCFQEAVVDGVNPLDGDLFEPLRERIRKGKGRVRKYGNDHLAYSIIDLVVDHYFTVLDRMGDDLEALKEEILKSPTPAALSKMNNLKRETIQIRKSVWRLRETIHALSRGESGFVQESTRFYLRDVQDHLVQVMDTIESYRESLSSMLDIYLSSISQKMNEIMKVLTIISTIFIPLTFIAGVYGMNFHYLPELTWRYGYFIVLGLMLAVALGMLSFFRRKGWI